MPPGEREPARPYSVAQRINRQTTPHEAETDRGGNQNRRRIAVACSRCRKRKIKCSGDPGNGQNCQNCKNANTEPGVCQFLRVRLDPGANGWFPIANAPRF
ncbi:MAG: hypothetical protein Q9187_001888 [Circinaria calcarea]